MRGKNMDDLSCYDIVTAGIVPESVECCESCHWDYEHEGISMCHPRLPDGRDTHVCCRVARWLYEHRTDLPTTVPIPVLDDDDFNDDQQPPVEG
jgi:hypothetical protein